MRRKCNVLTIDLDPRPFLFFRDFNSEICRVGTMSKSSTIGTGSSSSLSHHQQHHASYGSGAVRTRPAFEKLLIGPAMILGECVTGGHYLEVVSSATHGYSARISSTRV